MKKLISIISAVILCLSVSLPAFADGVGPFIEEITAYVNKSGGARVYSYTEPENENDPWVLRPNGDKIPDKTKLSLTWYEIENDIIYYNIEYGSDKTGFVRASDLSMDLKPVEPKEENKYDSPLHFTVINKDGAKMYAGPGISYDELKILPLNTEIEALYADGFSYGTASTWSYTEYDGVSGWVHTGQDGFSFDFGIPVKYKEHPVSPLGKVIVCKKLNVYNRIDPWEVNYADALAGTLPAGTEFTFDVYYSHEGIVSVPVDCNGIKGWAQIESTYVASGNYMLPVDGWLMVTDSTALYKDDEMKPGKETGGKASQYEILPYDLSFREVLGDIDEDDEGFWESAYEEWYRVTVDGEKYWLRYGSEITGSPCLFSGGNFEIVPDGNDISVYREPDELSDVVGTIESGEKYISLFIYDRNSYIADENGDTDYDPLKSWSYVSYDGLRGWIHYPDGVYPEFEAAPVSPFITFAEPENSEDSAGDDDAASPGTFFENLFGNKDDKKDAGERNPLSPESPRKTIGGSITGAAVAVGLAVIGIVRARKKKKD